MKYQKFNAMAQAAHDYEVEVFVTCNNKHGEMMTIGAAEASAIYITRQQAMDFFGLTDGVSADPQIGQRVRATMDGNTFFEGVLLDVTDFVTPYKVLLDNGCTRHYAAAEQVQS